MRDIKFNLRRDAFTTGQNGPGRCPSPALKPVTVYYMATKVDAVGTH